MKRIQILLKMKDFQELNEKELQEIRGGEMETSIYNK